MYGTRQRMKGKREKERKEGRMLAAFWKLYYKGEGLNGLM
jgi:hypothetical protein